MEILEDRNYQGKPVPGQAQSENALYRVLLTEVCQKTVLFKEEVEGGSRPSAFSKEYF